MLYFCMDTCSVTAGLCCWAPTSAWLGPSTPGLGLLSGLTAAIFSLGLYRGSFLCALLPCCCYQKT